MGQASSRAEDESICYSASRSLIDPVLSTEETLKQFAAENLPVNAQRNNRAHELTDLIIGSYEQLTNVHEILEEIIACSDVERSSVIDTLTRNFDIFHDCAVVRSDMKKITADYSARFVVTNDEKAQFELSDVIEVMHEALSLNETGRCDKSAINQLVEKLHNTDPVCSFHPPTPEFLSQLHGQQEVFSARYIHCHGICSNGMFLFVLCGNSTIQIFPLINSGCLMQPLQKQINAAVNAQASLVADRRKLTIYSGVHVISVKIGDLLSSASEAVAVETRIGNKTNSICHISDGFITARIDQDFAVHLSNTENERVIKSVRLSTGTSKLHQLYPVLFPQADYSQIPVLMNGCFIAFIFRVDMTTTLCRVFSLVTGKHVHDELFRSPDQIYAACFDGFYKCHWTVSLMDNNRLGVRRFYFAGCCEPMLLELDIKTRSAHGTFSSLVCALNNLLVHYADSQIAPPEFLVADVDQFYELLDMTLSVIRSKGLQQKHEYTKSLHVLCILIDLNLKYLSSKSKTIEMEQLFQVIADLPLDLGAVLFYNTLNHIDWKTGDVGISYLVGFFKRVKSDTILYYSMRKIYENGGIARVRFDVVNALSQILPSSHVLVSDVPEYQQTLLLVHQRVLISEARKCLGNPGKEHDNVIEYLYEYINKLLSLLDACVQTYKGKDSFDKSMIVLLIKNFIEMSSCLTDCHMIARKLCALCGRFLQRIIHHARSDVLSHADKASLAPVVHEFIMLYSKLISTLLAGAHLTVFEKKFTWLIRENLDIQDIQPIDDHILNQLVDEAVMSSIYKKYRPQMNRNLSSELQLIDKISLFVFCRYAGILDELKVYNSSQEYSHTFRKSLEQMFRVRSTVRSLMQRGKPISAIKQRCIMLYQMKFSGIQDPVDVAAFIFSDEDPKSIVSIIRQQLIRNDTILAAFRMANEILHFREYPSFGVIAAHCLSSIESYEGLDAVISISRLSEEQLEHIRQFLLSIVELSRDSPIPQLILIAFRFFRDCRCLPSIENEFLHGILAIIRRNNTQYCLFAVAMLLIGRINEIPESLLQFQVDHPLSLMLFGEAVKSSTCPKSLFKSYEAFFWKLPGSKMRLGCRIMYSLMASTDAPTSKTLLRLINYIGKQVEENGKLEKASDMTWILKRIIIERSSSYTTLMNLIMETETTNITRLTGVFCILNGICEPIRSFCTARIHSRSKASEGILVHEGSKDAYRYYPLPFLLNAPHQRYKITRNDEIYAYPILNLTADDFNSFDFILRFFDYAVSRPTTAFATVYMRSVASFMKFDAFCELVTPKHIEMLSGLTLLPFNTIWTTTNKLRETRNLKIRPVTGNFGTLHYSKNDYTSYISDQIAEHTDAFDITVRSNNLRGYIGIISDTAEGFSTRYSLIHFPSGRWYPFNQPLEVSNDNVIHMRVSPRERIFVIQNNHVVFPMGRKFKVLIAIPTTCQVDISAPESAFDPEAGPSVDEHGVIFYDNKSPLFKMPASIIDLNKTMWAEIRNYDAISEHIIDGIPTGTKVMQNFIDPPDYISLHTAFATECSVNHFKSAVRGFNEILVNQWAVVILARAISNRSNIIEDKKTLIKLFSLLAIPLEPFNTHDFSMERFPFDLSLPVWKDTSLTNTLYFQLDNDAKAALRSIIATPDFSENLFQAIRAMGGEKSLHLISHPHRFHTYYPPDSYPRKIRVSSDTFIVAFNDFNAVVEHGAYIHGNHITVPHIVSEHVKTIVPKFRRELSILTINTYDNTWVFDTPFELLLLIKSFVYLDKTPETRTGVKSLLIDCFVVQTPFIFLYLSEVMEFVQLSMPSTPYDKMSEFIQHMQLLGSILKTYRGPDSDRFKAFYVQEQSIMTSKFAADVASYFPEFFDSKTKKKTGTVKIPRGILDPAAITAETESYVKMLYLYAFPYKSLIDFPFHNLLPVWLRISGAWAHEQDRIQPQTEQISPEVYHISNLGRCIMVISLIPKGKWYPRSIVMVSETEDFVNARFIHGQHVHDPITTDAKDYYISLIDVPHLWNALTLRVKTKESDNSDGVVPKMVDPSKFSKQFVREMEEFAIKWTQEDTETLVMLLPRYALREPKAATVISIARGSALTSKYSVNVVLLRAVIIHHFNYLKYTKRDEVPEHVWDSMSNLSSIDDIMDTINDAITCSKDVSYPLISIDRRVSHRLIVEGSGNSSRSVISQLATKFRRMDPARLRCKKRPWKVKFIGEPAIDAGGPSRELLTEVATSIFEPTSLLCVPVPNARNDCGSHRETFIPFGKTNTKFDEYQAIGTFLGILLRTGFSQDLPFAPLVWKFIAREKLTTDDILAVDERLSDHFKRMKQAVVEGTFESQYIFSWTVEQWDGAIISLPGHPASSIVMQNQVSQYITESVQFRINSIMLPLKLMRNAFEQNAAFKTRVQLTGALLSRMAQGTPIISIEHLKSITVYSHDCHNGASNTYVQRFWRVLERFTEEQKKLFLRFVTTLTRLPNPAVNPDFKLQIDKMNASSPDTTLPTASTCFNRLYLPQYSNDEVAYEKILYAVQFCQTMENQ